MSEMLNFEVKLCSTSCLVSCTPVFKSIILLSTYLTPLLITLWTFFQPLPLIFGVENFKAIFERNILNKYFEQIFLSASNFFCFSHFHSHWHLIYEQRELHALESKVGIPFCLLINQKNPPRTSLFQALVYLFWVHICIKHLKMWEMLFFILFKLETACITLIIAIDTLVWKLCKLYTKVYISVIHLPTQFGKFAHLTNLIHAP